MKLARVAVLGIALGAGVIAAMLALNLTAPTTTDPTEPAQQVATDTIKVLVAAKDLPMGSTITQDKVIWRDWPKASVSEKFIQEIPGEADPLAKVTGAIARATFYEGEPINDAKLIHSDRGFMSAILPEGKRAVAIKIAAETSAGGFILPNDRVDVIMSRKAGRNPDAGEVEEYLTETILNNVRVLAIDQTIEEKGNGETVIGQTATLELTPQQAEIITVAGQISDRLALSLRSLADSTVSPSDAAGDASHLVGGTKRSGTVTVVKNGVAREVNGLR